MAKRPPSKSKATYEARKAQSSSWNKRQSAAGRDIGEIPPVADAKRHKQCRDDFRAFCETYGAESFPLAWSPDHLRAIDKIQRAVLAGELFAFAMPRGSGKALALTTPLPTPSGWTAMGKVAVGDSLYDEHGKPCKVVAATAVMTGRECYEVEFDDGEVITCCGDHLWTVQDRFSRRNPLTLRTEDMASRVVLSSKRGWSEFRYTIPVAGALAGSDGKFVVSPYVLGAWLGDGNAAGNRITIGDSDADEMLKILSKHENIGACSKSKVSNAACYTIGTGRKLATHARLMLEQRVRQRYAMGWSRSQIKKELGCTSGAVDSVLGNCGTFGFDVKSVSLKCRLAWIGVLGNKHIPPQYMRASEESRMELLRGLMDTDGSIEKKGRFAEYVTKLPALRDNVMELVASLGYKCRYRTKLINGKPYYRVTFSPTDGRIVFALPRKAARQVTTSRARISATRRIVAIRKVDSVPVRCVQVDSPSRLYLCGRAMIPTHNSTLCEWACLWAMLYGHRPFVMLVGADAAIAGGMLDSIKSHLEQNDLLAEDFPAACWPIRALEGISARARGQTCGGEPTHMEWLADKITLPWIKGAPCAGAAVRVAGITGRIRGVKHTRPDGVTVRPSLVLCDDPQTDESAASPSQVATRERVLSGAILGLGGPGVRMSGLCTITVIRPDDLADRLLDRTKHPAWQGERSQLVYEWPTDEDLWGQYAEIRRQGQRSGEGTEAADEFYRERQAAMDAGSRVAWPERKHEDELSAIHHAWNLRIDRGEAAFFAEYQNQPLADDISSEKLDRKHLTTKVVPLPRGVVPLGHNTLTAFVDVQERLLYWLVCSWGESFGGHVVAYGTYPDQAASVFEASSAKKTLANASKQGFEAALRAGLDKTVELLLGRDWKREDGAAVRIDRLLVDANWGRSTTTVRTFCRQSPFAASIYPSHGVGVGASSAPLAEKAARGDRIGLNWRISQMSAGQRSVRYDTNFWKSFVAARLRMGVGAPETITLHQGDHELLLQHLTSEFPVRTEARGRVVDEWKSAGKENHWLDGLVGAAVAASVAGVQPTATEAGGRQRRKISIPKAANGRKIIQVKRLGA